MLLYIFISKRANKSNKLIVWFHHISICHVRFYPHSTPSYQRARWKDHSAHLQGKPTLFFCFVFINTMVNRSAYVTCMEAQIWRFTITKSMKSALSVSLTGVKNQCGFLVKSKSACGPFIAKFNTEIRAKQLLLYLFLALEFIISSSYSADITN